MAPDIDVISREEELGALRAFLDSLGGEAAALLVEGEAGIGKSTLLRAAVSLARERGRLVLSCRPAEAETALAFAALGDLLGTVVEEVLPQLAAPQVAALEVALLRSEAGGRPPDARTVSVAALGALRALAAAKQVFVSVDDVQWLDRPSARVIDFALRRIDAEPIGVAVARRPSEQDQVEFGWGWPSDRIRRLRLGPLSVGALQRLLHSRLGVGFPRPTLLRLYEASRGNPFFALELAAALLAGPRPAPGEPLPVPDDLRTLVRGRLARLPVGAREAVVIVGALSQPTAALVEAALGRGQEGLAAALRAGVVELDADRVRLGHPLLGSVALADAPPGKRRLLHRRLASLLDDPEERARHLALAVERPSERIATALEKAAQRGLGRGAPEAAGELALRAAELTPPDRSGQARRRRMAAAAAYLEAGDIDEALALQEHVVVACPPGVERAEALRLLARIRFYRDDPAAAARLYEEALREAGDDARLRATVLESLAWTEWTRGNLPVAAVRAREAAACAEQLDDPTALAEILTTHGYFQALAGPAGLEILERALRVERLGEPVRALGSPRLFLGIASLHVGGDVERSRKLLTEAHELALERGEQSAVPWILAELSRLEAQGGELAAGVCVRGGGAGRGGGGGTATGEDLCAPRPRARQHVARPGRCGAGRRARGQDARPADRRADLRQHGPGLGAVPARALAGQCKRRRPGNRSVPDSFPPAARGRGVWLFFARGRGAGGGR